MRLHQAALLALLLLIRQVAPQELREEFQAPTGYHSWASQQEGLVELGANQELARPAGLLIFSQGVVLRGWRSWKESEREEVKKRRRI